MKAGAIMKLKSARLRNMKPIFRGSGQKEIFIDFSKSKHKTIFIIGQNGSGKSTIMNALQPLPESPSLFLDGEEGLKELEYIFEDVLYRIRIVYPVSNTKNRLQTKAFLYKILSDGEEIDLNPNGNIGSYKDALYTEFKLDPNFVSLARLSQDNKGLVSRTPSERKKFVNEILKDVQVYNDINKTLQKRSSIFRSMINSITAKINTVGDRTTLQHNLNAIQSNINTLEKESDTLTKTISDNQSMIRLLDPNGSIQNEFNLLCSEKNKIEQEINYISIPLTRYKNRYPNLESVALERKTLENEINNESSQLVNLQDQLEVYLLSREEENKTLQLKQQHLETLRSEFTGIDIAKEIQRLKEKMSEYESIFQMIGNVDTSITKNEYIMGLNTLNEMKDMIMTMRSFATRQNIEKAIVLFKEQKNPSFIKQRVENAIKENNEKRLDTEKQLAYYKALQEKTTILSKRPNKCKIDQCPFIEDALSASKQLAGDKIGLLEKQLQDIDHLLEQLRVEKDDVENLSDTYFSITSIGRHLTSNFSILEKIPIADSYKNIDSVLQMILDNDNFNEITVIYRYIEYANIFDSYRETKESLTKLEYEYKLYENKISIIEEIGKDIEVLTNKISNIQTILTDHQSRILELNESLEDKRKDLTTVKSLEETFIKLKELTEKRKELETKLTRSVMNMQEIQLNLESITFSSNRLEEVKKNLKPLKEEESKMKYSILKLDEYESELALYKKKYDMTELIKKYSSPTKGGIQTVFIKLYMSKTLSMTNEMLSNFFGGDMVLLPYVINESEFRIPCKNQHSTVLNDDISSCSGAEKSMIAMILSFALLRQSSTKYNILELDEIDETLDESNRATFPAVLDAIIEEMGVEQCLVISHSSEFDMSNADILLTKTNEEYNYNNVIFSYENPLSY